jgi:serine/threonine-protein kinase HipA
MVRLIEQMTVNVAIGNVDMHAKNVSLVADETGAVRMAPLYDIVPMLDYSPQGQSGLAVAGNSTLTEITRETLVLEATSWGVSQSVARETVNGAVAAMSWAVPDIDRLFPTLRRDVRRSALDQLDRLARP